MYTALIAFLVAGTIKGTLGVGLPVAAVALMAQFIDPRLAIALMVFPIMFANIWQFFRARQRLRIVQEHWIFALTMLISLGIATVFTSRISTSALIIFVGVVIILFSLTNLMFNPPAIPNRLDRACQSVFGVISGITGGLTAIWSPAIAIYLIGRGKEKDEFVGISGFLFLVGSIPLCIGFWQNGMLTGRTALLSMGMMIPTLIGFSIGEYIRRRIDARRFKTLVLVFFLLMGINLIRKGLV